MKVVCRYLAYVLFISAFFRIFPIIVGWYHGESTISFWISAIVSILAGLFFRYFQSPIKSNDETLHFHNALILVALSFIIIPLISAISFLKSFNYNIFNAFFESISGFTTTGLTLYTNLDALPQSLIFWRAMTQWLGGLGIVLVFLFLFSQMIYHSKHSVQNVDTKAREAMHIYHSLGFPEKMTPGLKRTVSSIAWIYIGYTTLGFLLLFWSGLPLLEAIAMSFTALSTGGFTVKDTFDYSTYQLIILGTLMLLGSISFLTHNKLIRREFYAFIISYEKNIFLLFLLAAFVIASFAYYEPGITLFQLLSAFTTTGFSIVPSQTLPALFIFMIMLAMIIGGGLVSTSGGIKVMRIFTLLKSIPWYIKKASVPTNAIVPLRVEGKVIEESALLKLGIFIFTYITFIITATIIFMLFGYSFLDSSFQTISALGTVGLQTMDLLTMPLLGKFILIIGMLLGRLEIFPLLILLRSLKLGSKFKTAAKQQS